MITPLNNFVISGLWFICSLHTSKAIATRKRFSNCIVGLANKIVIHHNGCFMTFVQYVPVFVLSINYYAICSAVFFCGVSQGNCLCIIVVHCQ